MKKVGSDNARGGTEHGKSLTRKWRNGGSGNTLLHCDRIFSTHHQKFSRVIWLAPTSTPVAAALSKTVYQAILTACGVFYLWLQVCDVGGLGCVKKINIVSTIANQIVRAVSFYDCHSIKLLAMKKLGCMIA